MQFGFCGLSLRKGGKMREPGTTDWHWLNGMSSETILNKENIAKDFISFVFNMI